MGDLDAAVEHFRQAVALQPDFAEARRNLAAAEAESRRSLVQSSRAFDR